jgi:hypothetical protein
LELEKDLTHKACKVVWIYICGFRDQIGCNMPKGKKNSEKKAGKTGKSIIKGLKKEAKKIKKQIRKEKNKIKKK